jgi:ribonuclease-3
MPEGRMTRLRAELVCEHSLANVARELDLGDSIRLGRGEDNSGGRTRPSILADAVEAVIAALYLEGGMVVARAFVEARILRTLGPSAPLYNSDYKTALQELIQRRSGQTLSYVLLSESGPDHNKTFTAQVLLNDEPIGTGSGSSKKEAEQAAARTALEDRKP